MMHLELALYSGIASLLLSLLLPFAVRPFLLKLGVVDIPTERSSHDRTVLRGLGLAVLVALTVSGSVATLWLWLGGDTTNSVFLFAVGVFSFVSGVLGFGEDLKGVSVPVRSAVLLFIAGGASASTVFLGHIYPSAWSSTGDPQAYSTHPAIINFYDMPVWLLVLIGVYGVFFISGFINVANFMDGLNGISGLHAVIAGVSFAVTGYLTAIPWLLIAGILLATAFGGFLPWNLSKRGGFLGDVGSYLLGGSIAVVSFAALAAGVPLLATIGPMVIYFGDVVVTLIKRIRAGHKMDEPHKEHVYQKLQQTGLSHVQASLIVASFSAATSALGIVSIFVGNAVWFAFLAAGLLILMFYLMLPKFFSKKTDTPGLH